MRLRYVGTSRVTFTRPSVGEVSPGDEFDVPDAETAGYLARADVIQVEETPVEAPEITLSLAARGSKSVPKPDPEPVTEPALVDTPDITGESADVATDS